MKPFFDSPERLQKLLEVAESWSGTPFMPNARIKGAGVSCQMLVSEIYKEAGHLPPWIEIPEGPVDWSNANTESLIEKFIDQNLCPHCFISVDFPPQPGDLLGLLYKGCVHHCAIVIDELRFIHAIRASKRWEGGTQFSRLDDATFLKRMRRVWRPVEHGLQQ